MRIAMFCSGRFTTPPPPKTIYAPLWITSVLANEMAKRGHKVTLFAAKGTKSKAKVETLNLPPLENRKDLKSCVDIREDRVINFYEQIFISEIYRRAEKREFDLMHIHPVEQAIGFAANSKVPTVFTLHDPISCWRKFAYSAYKKNTSNVYFVSLSHSQRAPLKGLNYIATIYNGIDFAKYPFSKKAGKYLFLASRIVPEKGFDIAIKAAKKAGLPLVIAGEIINQEYWQKKIKPFLGEQIIYAGAVTPSKLPELYRNAKAFIFPLQWEEPFGLVMIEAMACGAPVIAFDRGSVREVVEDGKTGFIIPPLNKKGEPNIGGMVEAVKKINTIDRIACRWRVEENFSLKRMSDEYEKIYAEILAKK
ncbi:glycosyltransferase family 4 protein [Patescibacteria group bacterium]|nr:glycosyltransferase family 4 protein [Patescibacteria group bacterium]MBU3999786.1 glycosyltransferase family 4 protein [Patescibacteria group bacterium]MBU4056367.1 glycosyltransferase family 4 protein [Patescibacteria group bacterium]MBU4368733.1 glycosyltransferase family 4 protein [Patescibacteria group bacterium]